MSKPTVPTQKRLFAVSGNRCAFRRCPQTLVDESTGKVIARICHIKGNKPRAKRHDPKQSETERQGFDNLLLMCPVHHDVIDADDTTYTVDVLRAIKAEHEAKYRDQPTSNRRTEELFLANVTFDVGDGSVILSTNQTGGQVAHIIHNNYGTAPPQQSQFRAELAKRHLADVDDPDFSRTTYQKKMGIATGVCVQPLRTTATIFAHSYSGWMNHSNENSLLQWLDCNRLRCEPCRAYPFIPGVCPDRIGSALIWSDGAMSHAGPGYLAYTRYLAIEPSGWVEYGMSPVDLFGNDDELYYAQLIANVVGFLEFLRSLCEECTIDPATVSLGIGLRGIRGAQLRCVTERLMRGYATCTPPEHDAMLFLWSSDDGAWVTSALAHEYATAVLEHWEFARPAWLADVPEFANGVYSGEFFRKRFPHW